MIKDFVELTTKFDGEIVIEEDDNNGLPVFYIIHDRSQNPKQRAKKIGLERIATIYTSLTNQYQAKNLAELFATSIDLIPALYNKANFEKIGKEQAQKHLFILSMLIDKLNNNSDQIQNDIIAGNTTIEEVLKPLVTILNKIKERSNE